MKIALTRKLVRYRRTVGVVLATGMLGALGALGGVAPAVAATGGWFVQSTAAPSNIPPGGEATITVTAEDVGNAPVSGTVTPVTVKDALPAGLEATGIYGFRGTRGFGGVMSCDLAEVSCAWSEETLAPYEALSAVITVKAAANAASGAGEIMVSGGGIPGVVARRPVTVSGAPTPFGLQNYTLRAEDEDGQLVTQAGSHPFQLTASIAMNQTATRLHPPAALRDLRFAMPAGLEGNPNGLPQCTLAEFYQPRGFAAASDSCPADTAIGVVHLALNLSSLSPRVPIPLFNLTPAGEPARFGFYYEGVSVILDISLRTGGNYGVTVTSSNTTEVQELLSATVTLWGVPGDPRHDAFRGWNCVEGGAYAQGRQCTPLGASQLQPLLTLPTSCTGPLTGSLSVTSWPSETDPDGLSVGPVSSEPTPGLEGCDRLPFTPELLLKPDTQVGGTPTGLTADVHIPQLESAEGLAEGNLKKAVVTLPAGVAIDPAGANGLDACTPEEIGLNNANPVSCPEAAKVGTAEAVSPALKTPLEGSVYVAQQGNNPFGSLLALYLVVEGQGVLVKTAGEVRMDPVTGQVTSTFDNIPQQQVEEIKLHFFGGAHGPLSTPVACGTYTATSQLTPYNTLTPAEPSSAFQITSGPNGTGCAPQGFTPSFTGGTVNNQAGAFSPLSVTFSRQDQEQNLAGVTLKTPPGLLGILKSVRQCGEPQASQGTCGAGSLIGHVTTTAGEGLDPISVGGQVFLTGPYKGAPFGLSIVVPAVAGPFNLGNVVVRGAIGVDPHTARITVTSDPLPTILQGIPLQVRTVNVSIDREGFMFNPTSCEPLTVGGTLTSTQGASANVSSRFQAANCAALGFKPSFTVSTQAGTSKKNGASLDVKVGYPKGAQANLRSAAVTLPKQLPSRLSTIQQACPQATFAANPASCPAGSNIGIATATTPVLANPVTGPAYLVSHGGAAFPDLVLILQGEGVKLELTGSIDIKKSITSSTFATIPDAPISSFELILPEGPHSGLAAVLPAKAKGNMCGSSLIMPTTLTGQNGAVIKQNTKIAVTGCAKAKPKKKATRRAQGKPKKHRKAKKQKGK